MEIEKLQLSELKRGGIYAVQMSVPIDQEMREKLAVMFRDTFDNLGIKFIVFDSNSVLVSPASLLDLPEFRRAVAGIVADVTKKPIDRK